MTARARPAEIFAAVRSVPLWMWPVWAGGVVIVFGLISLLFFTSDTQARAVIVNDTAVPLRLFYCSDSTCRRGDGSSDEIIRPGEATIDYWVWADDDTGLIGVATLPDRHLVGCLSDPHAGKEVGHPYAILASSLRPCPGQTPGEHPVVILDDP